MNLGRFIIQVLFVYDTNRKFKRRLGEPVYLFGKCWGLIATILLLVPLRNAIGIQAWIILFAQFVLGMATIITLLRSIPK